MLKTYRIIPLVFILFLFGFTLITVAPVLAEDSPEFVACLQMPFGNQNEARQKKNCFRDVARLYHRQLRDSVQSVVPLETSGGEVAELNARIAESESQVATLTTTNTQLQGDLRKAQEALVPLNAKVTQSHLDREEAVLLNNACVARYTTDMERGNGAIVAVDILKAKLRIEQKGVEHMGILLEKMISHHAFHKRKSHQSSRSALVIHESMRYELSCMSSHVDDVAWCAKLGSVPPGERSSGGVYLHRFE